MKFLLVPGNNSLSHLAKCFVLEETLSSKGHEVLIAVNKKHSFFIRSIGKDHVILPDIQEADDAPFPTIYWFKNPNCILECIRSEIKLIKTYKPHRVLGVFRFTTRIAAGMVGVPYDSLICGCMLPTSKEVLGFAEGEAGIELQRENFKSFYHYINNKINLALKALDLPDISDLRELLKGERTFLWDFPEFMPIQAEADVIHIGPLTWKKWPHDDLDLDSIVNNHDPLALVAFGTGHTPISAIERLMTVLLDLGYRVLLAAGGQKKLLDIVPRDAKVITCKFAPLEDIFPYISLLICHGGQMTVFEALRHKIPTLVMPFQPEQAHNGVCLERLGCGRRLVPSQPFRGFPEVYVEALQRMSDQEIKSIIISLASNPQTAGKLSGISALISKYNGVETLANRLED